MRVPLIARNLLDSIKLLAAACAPARRASASAASRPNEEMLERHAEATLQVATALNPHIGYDTAAEIVKEAAELGPDGARGRDSRRASTRRSSTRRSTTARWPARTSNETSLSGDRMI